LALFNSKKLRANKVIAVDISSSMLVKAKRKLPLQDTTLLRADVCQLPFKTSSINTISCFGGFNSFPSGEKAMLEIARCLSQSGIVRGSVLLMPKASWRKRLVHRWIKQGYQTEVVTFEKFKSWVLRAGLSISHQERHGDVLLFELRHVN
jgi:ubiquinone/menaquinone biosynthesis C-methylase UbiE